MIQINFTCHICWQHVFLTLHSSGEKHKKLVAILAASTIAENSNFFFYFSHNLLLWNVDLCDSIEFFFSLDLCTFM